MRKMTKAAAAMLAVCAGTAAQATPITAGQTVAASPVTMVNGTILASYADTAFTSQAPAGQTSSFSGTYRELVYKDTANNLCASAGNCLTFAIRVSNSSTSRDPIETVTSGPFSSLFSYNVGYVAAAGNIAPLYISDSSAGNISFIFTNPGSISNAILPGQTSDYLVIQSSAMNFASSLISFQDSQTATVAGFIPALPSVVTAAVPEPTTWAMMLLGVGAIGVGLRRRRGVTTQVQFA